MNLASIQSISRAARLAIHNTAKDPDAVRKMAGVGFNDKRMREGENLLILVEAQLHTKEHLYLEGLRISAQIEKEVQNFRPLFVDHVATARYVFRQEAVLLKSLISKGISTNLWTWVAQAHTFYTRVMAYATQMAAHGVSQEELEQALTSVEALMALREDRIYKKGEAEDSTERKNQSVRQLKSWIREFHAAARLAMKDNPQKLEAFGIKVRTVLR